MIRGAIVDVDALLEVVWVSLVAGIGLTAAFSVAVYGLARGAEHQRFYLLAVVALAVCAWALWRGYDLVATG